MSKYTGARLIVEALKLNRAKYLIGIHGAQTLPILDILYDDHEIEVVTVRHEEAAAFAACGYAKITGQPAVCFSIQGPGATNMVTSVTSAFEDSLPMVVISAQVSTSIKDRTTSHQCDLESIFRPVTKGVLTCRHVSDIPAYINQAFRLSTEGRNGPVMVLVPTDLITATVEMDIPQPAAESWKPTPELEKQIEQAASIIQRSESTAIFAGGGVAMSGAAVELRQMAEKISAPVFTSRSGRGILPEDHRLSAGLLSFSGSEGVFANADSCIALGTRFSDFSLLNWKVKFPADLIEVNISPSAMGKVYKPRLAIVSDAKHFLRTLAGMVSARPGNEAMLKALDRAKQARREETAKFMERRPEPPFHPRWMILTFRDHLPDDTTYAIDATSAPNWFHEHEFVARQPGKIVSNSGFSSMGFSLPAAIGAKLARPDLKVVCVVGDGSIMMQLGELATACAYRIAVPIIVMNDGNYNVLRQFQHYLYRQRYIATELNNPNFIKLAESFGMPAFKINHLGELIPRIEESFRRNGPTLLDLPIDPLPVSRMLWNRWVKTGQVKE